ncbi:MAG: acetyl/propionyl/methylcrotonyl-CoA carboxylase subunit alpha [Gammaproteobacteria bacterium]
MFNKILIANRGEIACRVIKTARRLGIRTVAVYSKADARALHVQLADQAVLIGPAPSAQSYLNIERIVAACQQTGAEAVHPGYGFLSEKAAFAQALASAGIAFIGPNVEAIEAMGDKIASKRLAERAGVNVIPGFTDVLRDAEHAVSVARDIGYPVMLKASAGGGGKGMRIAWNDAECREGFTRASSEAKSSFGDDRVFLEKFIEEPRHIEIQIMADRHGNVLYLGERECSIQRRHQKVIEESPSPFIDAATRRAMGEQAVALARAVNYRSAGTVEFVVDRERRFYFLEMNTRLQVEHPVTEMVTGLDLVELMIRVAAAEPLGIEQDDLKQSGWALEARVYAEDPLRGFLPSTGRLARYAPPAEGRHIRVDTGVYEGAEVSIYYDPMIAKLIAWNINRDQAIASLRAALDEFHIQGVTHNIGFLSALLGHPRFREGRLSTQFIAEEYPEGYQPAAPAGESRDRLIIVAAALHYRWVARAAAISGQLPGHGHRPGDDWTVLLNGERYPVTVSPHGSGQRVVLNDERFQVESEWRFGEPLARVSVNGEALSVQIEQRGIGYRLIHDGVPVEVLVLTPRAAEFQALMPVKEPPDLSRFLLAPMPGLLVQLLVREGEEVKSGQPLAVVEAMKMENILRAVQDGKVAILLAKVGDSLSVDQPIIEFV